MNREISIRQYVVIDILILSLILTVLMWASSIALKVFPNEIFTISIVLPVVLIAMMRHGAKGIILAVVGAIVYCMTNRASWDVYLVYLLGNLMIVFNLLWFKYKGKDSIKANTTLIVLFTVSGYVLMNLGRGIFALIFGYRPFISVITRYFTTDALSAVMAVIIILIARRQDGVFEDQIDYLERLAAEEEQLNERKA